MAYRRTISLRDGRGVELPSGIDSADLEQRYWGELVRAQAAMVALGFVAAICAANAALVLTDRASLYGDVVAMSLSLLVLVSAATFLIWLHHSVSNAWRIWLRPLDQSPSWAVLCWFVPLVNLVHPLRVIKSLYDASDPELLPELDEMEAVDNPTYREPARKRLRRQLDWDKPLPLGAWWSCLLAGAFIVRMGMIQPRAGDLLADRMLGWAVSGHLALVIAAVSAILVIRSVVARRGELYRRLSLMVDRED